MGETGHDGPTSIISGYERHCIELRDVPFHYLEWGSRRFPPLVLLHGLTGHAHIWDHMAPLLASAYHVFAPDQRGHGDSGHTDSYATGEFVADLEALRSAWNLEQFALCGLSMGGHNAMAYASQYPQRVTQAIFIDIPPRLQWGKQPDFEQVVARAQRGHAPFATLDEAYGEARAANQTAPEANLRYRTLCNVRELPDGRLMLKYDARAAAFWDPADLTDALPNITMPALFVRGGLSNLISADAAKRIVGMLPHGELATIDDSGHSVPTDRPERLAPVIMEWLERTRA